MFSLTRFIFSDVYGKQMTIFAGQGTLFQNWSCANSRHIWRLFTHDQFWNKVPWPAKMVICLYDRKLDKCTRNTSMLLANKTICRRSWCEINV